MPKSAERAVLNILGSVVLIGAFGLAIAAIVVSMFLALGGGILLVRSSERDYRMVGLAITEFLTITTTPI